MLFVLVAVLVVMSRDRGPAPPPSGSALPLRRAAPAARAAPRPPSWSAVPIATSVVALGPALSRPVADGLAAARARIERCVAVERRRAPPVRDVAAGRVELVLRLAARAGAVHVAGVEAGAPEGGTLLADCARRQLDGDAFPAPAAVAGQRHRLLVTLP